MKSLTETKDTTLVVDFAEALIKILKLIEGNEIFLKDVIKELEHVREVFLESRKLIDEENEKSIELSQNKNYATESNNLQRREIQ